METTVTSSRYDSADDKEEKAIGRVEAKTESHEEERRHGADISVLWRKLADKRGATLPSLLT